MSSQLSSFGYEMRQQFLFEETWTNLNHGAFGAYPKPVADARAKLINAVESAPDRFLRYNYVAALNESRGRLAEYLHVPVSECVLVPNASSGIETILRNLRYGKDEVILCFDTTYDAVQMALLSIQENQPQVRLRSVGYGCSKQYILPMTHDEICQIFQESVEHIQAEGLVVKVAVFDTITSIPAVRMPFERLTKICRQQDILSVVDGAHGVGQIALDLGHLDADFFVSNCHKWLYTPRGCAVLHTPSRNQNLIRNTFPTSWRFVPCSSTDKQNVCDESSRFINQFQFTATADNSPLYCIAAALDFRQHICGGEDRIRSYIQKIAQEGADVVADILGTRVMEESKFRPGFSSETDGGLPASRFIGLRDCAMANVLLPLTISSPVHSGESVAADGNIGIEDASWVISWMQSMLVRENNTSVSIFIYSRRIWVRLSGQIYLDLSDFEWFASCLKNLCRRVQEGEPLRNAQIEGRQ